MVNLRAVVSTCETKRPFCLSATVMQFISMRDHLHDIQAEPLFGTA